MSNRIHARLLLVSLLATAVLLCPSDAWAIGGRGGGGGGRVGGMAGRQVARPAPRPVPKARPQTASPNRQRPQVRPQGRPTTRPGGDKFDRPNKLPEKLPSKDVLTNRPTTLPGKRPRPGSFPDFGGDHGLGGNLGGGNLGGGGARPSLPRPGAGRPTKLPAKVKPGQLGDFLGIDGVKPALKRPDWQKLQPDRVTSINNQWNVAVGNKRNNFTNWNQLHPDRNNYWQNWGGGIRNGWNAVPGRPWFNNNWWATHPFVRGWWHYGYATRPWYYWWTVPTWTGVNTWFAPYGWTGGYYYDYGTGGNVVYEDNRVFIDGEPVATSAEFAQSAAELAAVEPPADEQTAADAEWLPLGTFGFSLSPDDSELTRVVQLAVNKAGIVSGTLFNTKTDQATTLQGKVDKQTQRVALMVVDKPDVVMETGLYNLTQAEAPAMIHYGDEKSEPALLVRLEQPEPAAEK